MGPLPPWERWLGFVAATCRRFGVGGMEETSFPQIAGELGISADTARRQAGAAIDAIRVELGVE